VTETETAATLTIFVPYAFALPGSVRVFRWWRGTPKASPLPEQEPVAS
jgi:hypothetical protein